MTGPLFQVTLAQSDADILAVQRLRFDVFVSELGGNGADVDHDAQLERDQYDAYADHFVLRDLTRPAADQVVGTYRVMTRAMADAVGQFYCADEYDLSPLLENGGTLLELGRSCLHPDYRGGAGMLRLWAALADYIAQHRIDTLFGVASFHGTDVAALRAPLSLLHHRHLAPSHLRVTAKGQTAQRLDFQTAQDLDRVAAVRSLPALIKAYLRLGATVGEGAFVDHAFNTTDICLILQKDAIQGLQKAIYTKDRAGG